MPLESLQPDAKTNVRHVTAEAAEKSPEAVFDAKLDVPSEFFKKTERTILELREKEDWGKFLEIAHNYVLLFPERKKGLPLNDEVWEKAKEELKLRPYRSIYDYNPTDEEEVIIELNNYIKTAMRLKILWPEKFSEIKLRNNALNEFYDMHENIDAWSFEIDQALFFQNKLEKSKQSGSLEWNFANDELDDFGIDKNDYFKTWLAFARKASNFRLMFPEEFECSRLNSNNWRKILEQFNKGDKEFDDGSPFLEDILHLQILGAEKVEFTDEGLMLTMPKIGIIDEEIPPVPQIKE